MEGAADLQWDHPPGAGLQSQCPCPLHSGGVSGDDQLAGTVVVGDLGQAQRGCGGAGGAEGFPVQMGHCGHAAGTAGDGLSHDPSPEGHQLDGGLGRKNTGGSQRGVLAQAQARRHGGTDPRLIEQGGHTGGEGHHAGLGVPGVGELLLRAVKAEFREIEVHRRGIKDVPEEGKRS